MRICLKIAVGRTAGFDDTAALGKDGLFPAVHHFIGAGIVGIAVPDRTVGVQIIFQVGVGDGVRVERIDIAGHLKGFRPACFGGFLRRNAVHITVLFHVLTDLRHQVGSVAFAADTGPPSKMVQPEVSHHHLFAGIKAAHARHFFLKIHRHVADIQNAGVGA